MAEIAAAEEALQRRLLAVQAAEEAQRVREETLAEEAERKRLAYEAAIEEAEAKKKQAQHAAEEAERKRVIAQIATQEAERKRNEFMAAAQRAEQQRIDDERISADAHRKRMEEAAIIESIRRDIEETLKEQIEFVKNKSDITEQGQLICNKVVPLLKRMPHLVIHIESHTNCFLAKCEHGCILMELSQERVDNVRNYFINAGCTNQFIAKGWGCKHPEHKNVRLVRIFPQQHTASSQ